MVIQHNMPAINSQNRFKKNNSRLSKSLEKLSSGYAVNRAGDNAAGLAVSEKMRSQICGIKQSVQNCADGVSLIQTFEGALGETVSIIHRARDLAVQAANGTYQDDVDREAIEIEYLQFCDEVNHIAETDFNGVVMLNGGKEIVSVIHTGNFDLVPFKIELTGILNNTDDPNLKVSIQTICNNSDIRSDKVYEEVLGKYAERCNEFSLNSILTLPNNKVMIGDYTCDFSNGQEDFSAETAYSTIEEVDVSSVKVGDRYIGTAIDLDGNICICPYAISKIDDNGPLTSYSDIFFSEGIVLAKLNINKSNPHITGTLALDFTITLPSDEKIIKSDNLTFADNLTLQAGSRTKDSVNFTFAYNSDELGGLEADLDCTANGLGMDKLSLATQEQANLAIDKLDNALNKVSMIRSTFGAAQNRLEHKIDNLNNNSENLTYAESRIRDTDMAKEMMNFTKEQILTQSSQAMLAQANSLPQSVLNLIAG